MLLTRCDVIIPVLRRCVANHCLINRADLCGHVRQQVRASTYNRPTFNFGVEYRCKGLEGDAGLVSRFDGASVDKTYKAFGRRCIRKTGEGFGTIVTAHLRQTSSATKLVSCTVDCGSTVLLVLLSVMRRMCHGSRRAVRETTCSVRRRRIS